MATPEQIAQNLQEERASSRRPPMGQTELARRVAQQVIHNERTVAEVNQHEADGTSGPKYRPQQQPQHMVPFLGNPAPAAPAAPAATSTRDYAGNLTNTQPAVNPYAITGAGTVYTTPEGKKMAYTPTGPEQTTRAFGSGYNQLNPSAHGFADEATMTAAAKAQGLPNALALQRQQILQGNKVDGSQSGLVLDRPGMVGSDVNAQTSEFPTGARRVGMTKKNRAANRVGGNVIQVAPQYQTPGTNGLAHNGQISHKSIDGNSAAEAVASNPSIGTAGSAQNKAFVDIYKSTGDASKALAAANGINATSPVSSYNMVAHADQPATTVPVTQTAPATPTPSQVQPLTPTAPVAPVAPVAPILPAKGAGGSWDSEVSPYYQAGQAVPRAAAAVYTLGASEAARTAANLPWKDTIIPAAKKFGSGLINSLSR